MALMLALTTCVGAGTGSFPLFLKECKFRFNDGAPKQQLKILRWFQI